ncbi:MAG: Calx-beta domain-containing protein, partial [Opitutales bacterium]
MYHKALISWKAGLHIGAVFRCPLSRLRLNALLLPFIIAYASGQEVTEAKLKGMDFFRPPEYAADPGNWLHGGDPRGSFDQAFGRFIGITGDLAFIGDLFTEDALAYSLSRREIVNKFDLVGTRGFAVSPQSFLYTATEVQGLGFTETTFNFIDTETALTRSILVDAGFSIPIGFGLHVFDDYWADFRFRFLTARDLAREGEILWQLESEGDEEFLAMAGFGYSIFVVVGHPDLIFDTRLECYDLRTGEKRWDYEYTRGGAVTLSAGFGRAVISSMDAFLVIDAATGGLAGTMPAGNFGRSGLPFAGSAAIGSQFIAVQTTSAPATSPTSPGIALYSLNELDHLLDIPNPWLVVGDATPNTFASEMAIQGPRILANFESPAEQQPNPVYDIELELSVGGGTFGPGDRFIYLGTQNFETNENDRLSALLLLSQPADVPVSATITPVALSGHDAATAGADFPVQPQVVVIPPGKTFTTFEIPVIDDAEREDLERFKIELSNPQNARLFTEGAIVTLSSDDFDPLTELVPLSEVPVEDFSDGGARDIAVGESFIIAAKSSGGEGNGLLAFDPYTRELRIDVDAPVAGEDFGASVDIHGDLAIAGAPRAVSGDGRAYLVDLSDGTILDTLENPDASNAPNFGQRVRLHGDYAVVGADQAGTVFVFERDGDSFSFLRQLDSPRTTTTFGETFDLNATQVAVSSYSGNAIDINDPDDPYFEARIFLYDLASGTLELTIEGERPLGRYALSLEGEELLAARGDVIERFTLPGTSVVESYEQPAERWNAIGFNGAFGAFTANLGGTLFWRDFARDVEGSAILGSGIQYFGHGSVVDGRGEPAIITGASTGARVFGAAASSDILVTTFSDQGDRPLVYQIPSEYGVSVSGGSFDEGAENASIRFSLTQPAPETVEVFFETVEDSAKAGTDFTATRGSVTIPTDSTEATAEIPILDNGNFDGPRRFYVTILGARNASIGDLISSVFITDNEVIDP